DVTRVVRIAAHEYDRVLAFGVAEGPELNGSEFPRAVRRRLAELLHDGDVVVVPAQIEKALVGRGKGHVALAQLAHAIEVHRDDVKPYRHGQGDADQLEHEFVAALEADSDVGG